MFFDGGYLIRFKNSQIVASKFLTEFRLSPTAQQMHK